MRAMQIQVSPSVALCGSTIFNFLLWITICCISSEAYQTTFLTGGGSVQLKDAKYGKQCQFKGLTMYFDDVSRYTTKWGFPSKDGAPFLTGLDENIIEKRASDKLDCLRRLNGYHLETAASLSPSEVEFQIRDWADRSGLVGSNIGDEVYEAIRGVYVSEARTIPEAMSDFWSHVLMTIKEGSEGPVEQWSGGSKNSQGSSVSLIAFPQCEELYDYKVMSTAHAAIDFCSDFCLHFGTDFTLTHFHPKYKNAPKMVYPTRHSPFPCFGLHFGGEFDDYVARLSRRYGLERSKQAISQATPPPTREWVKKRAATFEVLLNKAAASSTQDDLGRPTSVRNLSQRFPEEEVIDSSKAWMLANKFRHPSMPSGASVTSSKREPNKALEFADTVGEWSVVYDKSPEEIYAKIWDVIQQLDNSGAALDKAINEGNEVDSEEQKRYSQLEWMSLLPLPFRNRAACDTKDSFNVISSVFLTTKFRAYNAEGFKRFAVTVHAGLKRLTGGKIFLEVFHPEYVGRKGYDSKLRRSPFPMIQVCYNVGQPKTSKDEGA